ALALVGLRVDIHAHDRSDLAAPQIALELAERDHVQAIELDVSELAGAHVPGEHALAVIAGRRLRELAGAGDVATANVEPIAGEPPLGNSVHAPLLPKCNDATVPHRPARLQRRFRSIRISGSIESWRERRHARPADR